MTHREFGREPSGWRKAARDLLVTVAFLAAAAVLFVSGELLFYGHVNW